MSTPHAPPPPPPPPPPPLPSSHHPNAARYPPPSLPPPQQQSQQSQQQSHKSRFHFQIDTRAPAELHHLEDEVIRKRQEYKRHIFSLHQRLASINCTLSNEVMDCDAIYNEMMEKTISRPLEQAVERVCARMERTLGLPFLVPPSTEEDEEGDEVDNEEKNEKTKEIAKGRATKIERQIHSISSTLHKNAHVNYYDNRTLYLDSLKQTLQNDVEPTLKLEQSKRHKVENGIVRRFESCAAELEGKLAEEQVSRYSSLEALKEEVDMMMNVGVKREEGFLREIGELRERLRVEREERRKRDEEVVERIVKTKVALQKIVLESLGGSSSGGIAGVGGVDVDDLEV